MLSKRKLRAGKNRRGGRAGARHSDRTFGATEFSTDFKYADSSRTVAVVSAPGGVLNGFGDATRVRLAYNDQVGITSTSGVGAFYTFAGNDCFDPNVTGTGTQPVNFDVFAQQYLRYRVIGSTCVIRGAANPVIPYNLVLWPTNQTTAIAVNEAYIQPYAVNMVNINAGGGAAMTLRQSMKSSKILGRRGAQFWGSDENQAQVTASPNEAWYWRIGTYEQLQTTTYTLTLSVTIVFDVVFFDRKPQILSLLAKSRPTLSRAELKAENLAQKSEKGDEKSGKPDSFGRLSHTLMEDHDWEEVVKLRRLKSVAKEGVPGTPQRSGSVK